MKKNKNTLSLILSIKDGIDKQHKTPKSAQNVGWEENKKLPLTIDRTMAWYSSEKKFFSQKEMNAIRHGMDVNNAVYKKKHAKTN